MTDSQKDPAARLKEWAVFTRDHGTVLKTVSKDVLAFVEEVEKLREREFNHYPIEIYNLEMRMFALREALERIYEVETDSYEMDKELMFNIARDALVNHSKTTEAFESTASKSGKAVLHKAE